MRTNNPVLPKYKMMADGIGIYCTNYAEVLASLGGAPSAPLVAVGDALPELPQPCSTALVSGPQGSEYRTLAKDYAPAYAQYSADQMREYASQCLAGQVAPQATVEPLTDEATAFAMRVASEYERDGQTHTSCSNTAITLRHEVLRLRALLAATPPTSKATRKIAIKCICGDPDAIGVVHRTDGPCFVYEATSKADTGSIRNAALEEAANIHDAEAWNWQEQCDQFTRHFNDGLKAAGQSANICRAAAIKEREYAERIRALKSATPSTIKEEPTNAVKWEESQK